MSKKRKSIILVLIVFLLLILVTITLTKVLKNNAGDLSKDNVSAEDKEDLVTDDISDSALSSAETEDEGSTQADLPDDYATSAETEMEQSVGNAHTHKWVAKQTVVKHAEKGHYEKECVKEAWTEEVPKYEEIAVEVCSNCGAEFTTDPSAHIKEHMLNGTGSKGCHTEYRKIQTGTEIITHEAEYKEKWVVDEKEREETITTYTCACGAKK